MATLPEKRPLFDPPLVRQAVLASFAKLDPRHQVRNPVMFIVEVGSLLTTLLYVLALGGRADAPPTQSSPTTKSSSRKNCGPNTAPASR